MNKISNFLKKISFMAACLIGLSTSVGAIGCSATYYNLTLINENEDGGTLRGEGTFKAGSEVTISYTANNGYKFTSWDIDGEQIKVSNKTYTFKMPNKDITIKGSFVTKQYNFRFDVNGYQGCFTTYKDGEPFDEYLGDHFRCNYLDELTFTVEINSPGFEVTYWELNDEIIANNVETVSFKMPDKECRLRAYVDRLMVNIHYSSNMEGFSGYSYLDPKGNELYEQKVYSFSSLNNLLLTDAQHERYINPVTGNKFAAQYISLKNSSGNVLVSGYGSFGEQCPYTCPFYGSFSTTDEELYCEVTFRDFVHVELISEHGKISHPDYIYMTYGDIFVGYTKRLEAKPYSGYTFEGWYVDGELYSTSTIMSFVTEKDMTIEAKYQLA